MSNALVADKTAVSVVWVTFSESLIDCAQVQVDSIMYSGRHYSQVDSIVQVKRCREICL